MQPEGQAPRKGSPDADQGPAREELEQGIRDLLGLLALPSLWAGRDGKAILQLTLEAAERIVPLRVCHAQANLLPDTPTLHLLRVDGHYLDDMAIASWAEAVGCWNEGLASGATYTAVTPLGPLHMVRLSMGFGSYGGNLWFGAESADALGFVQLAFLRAAASLAASGLQAARANHEREQASRAKDEFLAMLGHELRNPLTPIIMSLELMKRRSGGEEPPREHQIIERQARHLSRMVDDLLDVTRITRGRIELNREVVELQAVLHQAVEEAGALIESQRHQLTLSLPEEPVQVFGDATRLIQVFCNLLTNAAKYTSQGGRIDVTMQRAGDRVEISVRDNGVGISEQLQPRLFTIFEQGTATIDRAKGGLGIGLALVRSFVACHDGSVEVHSEGPGKGSEFIVRLPVSENQPVTAAEIAPDRSEQDGRLRILLVDDNSDALETTREYLVQQEHRLMVTGDPLEALHIAQSFRPDLAILDIGLPVMDGYTLGRELRVRLGDSLRLVALTGYGQARDHSASRLAGFDGHLVKPVRLVDLDAAVRGRRSASGSA
jgi:signal transduction histidine kinase/ActR/RegA family two-component response regulator